MGGHALLCWVSLFLCAMLGVAVAILWPLEEISNNWRWQGEDMENTWVLEDAAGLEMLSSEVVAMRVINYNVHWYLFSSVQFSCSVVSDSLWPHELQHTRPPCPSPTQGVHSNSCALSQWCHPAISSSVIPFSSCPQSLPASGSFPMSQLFAWGGQSIGVSTSASVLPMNTQDWSPSEWTGWTSLQSKGLLRVFSNTIVQKYQLFK